MLKTFTKNEIEESVGAALAAPPSADSAAKAKFKFAESRRKKEQRKTQKLKSYKETNKHDQIYCLLSKIHR
ncbi:hypothetical protein A3J20_03955 [Candidatus Gottesmanbacteria bacterium RIFCSPLOWO2_02_FULL_42_29]|nr:MAG: hypothetical protein A3E72_04375 [Candidatus Gottesmanbacteria bacterium RIFCSPHIGHO2_12_FULL_43_26]OGG33304.1 MAG: hypothetical protein A3G68_06845 [Candidatus Gottesmanbacteria bacterium RIFCSPLOWO2_12_FULL_42_10]OGG39489.1 MAG: hypothetical protein A3J20_03955 [Candidatus Gottesmanbacteria bacterium RIFCSPLOWO2_02_FULL_42_29]